MNPKCKAEKVHPIT